MNIGISKNNVPIRLTDERWRHITFGHPEIADYFHEILETIESPELIYRGNQDGLIAVSAKDIQSGKFIVVVYKEISLIDGFVITAYFSKKEQSFLKKEILWKQ